MSTKKDTKAENLEKVCPVVIEVARTEGVAGNASSELQRRRFKTAERS